MMLFKLSFKNLRKSMKDYTIYFLTLILGVAIFYVFNALESQQAMTGISASSHDLIQLMVTMLSFVSVIVAFILGFLIVYANNFLIKRRKKEFGVYMMLGMGKGGISKILFGETILIGILSLGIGLFIGVFASQFMSILVAKLFEADLSAYTFTISISALQKTTINFGIMYIIVLLFNAFTISRYKLIDLFHARQKGEKQKIKNTGLAVIVFIVAVCILGYAYYQVGYREATINEEKAGVMIVMGCIGTFLVFWSLTGFLLKFVQRFKRLYYKNLNAFILRQLGSNINTAVFSMTVICLLLFVTICAFSSGISMNNALRGDLQEMTPVDMCMQKTMDLTVDDGFDPIQVEKSHESVAMMLEKMGFSMDNMAEDYVEITIYTSNEINYGTTLSQYEEEVSKIFSYLRMDYAERIVGVSEYNKIAALYGNPTYELDDSEYLMICEYDNMEVLRNLPLKDGVNITIGDFTLKPAFADCQKGILMMGVSNTDSGFILVPDAVIAAEAGKLLTREKNFLAGNYNTDILEEKKEIDTILVEMSVDRGEGYRGADGITKLALYEGSVGLAAIIVFVVLYLGIVFLISGAALLALKALSETTDSKGRYEILQKTGADEKMIHHALFWQIGLFFMLPLLLAIIHSYFGMRFISFVLVVFKKGDMLSSMGVTAAILLLVYGGYFIATYNGSKRIIDEK